MATICGFPGSSPDQLPFVHASFPATQRTASGRYYTNTPRKENGKKREKSLLEGNHVRGKDNEEIKLQTEDLQLPRLELNCEDDANEKKAPSWNSTGYIHNNKACFRLKGINPNQVYCRNRMRPNLSESHRDGEECLRINGPSKFAPALKLTSSHSWSMAVESIAEATLSETNKDLEDMETKDKRVAEILREKLDEDNPIPGLRQKRGKCGRKLGNIVSAKRLHELLENKERSLPYTYYQTTI